MLVSVENIQKISQEICHDFSMIPQEHTLPHRCGRYLLEKLYLQHITTPMPALAKSPTGKPYFLGGNYHFNISHSDTLVAVALSTQAVGIDIQRIKSPKPSLIERVCSEEEQVWLSGLPEDKIAQGFTALWTGKEAIQKESGEGIGSGRNLPKISIPYIGYDTTLSQSYTSEIFLHRRLGQKYCFALACREEISMRLLEKLSLP